MDGALVSDLDECGSIAITYSHGEAAPSRISMRKIAAEGEVLDSDGIAIHFLLFERERLLCELQIYKDDGSPIKRSVDVEDVEPMTLR